MVNAILSLLTSLMFNGQVYTVEYTGMVKLNKGGRKGIAPNPLFDRVTRKSRVQLRLVPYTTSREKLDGTPRTEGVGSLWNGKAEHVSPLVVKHVDTGKHYVLCDKTMARYLDYEYLVDNRQATEDEIKIIQSYLPSKSESAVFMLNIDDITSVKAMRQVA